MNLLPFNLEQALKDPARVVYRNGEKPLQWHWMEKANQEDYCITSVLSDGSFETHLRNGRVLLGWDTDSSDLFLLPLPEKTYWVNVYVDSEGKPFFGDMVFETEPPPAIHPPNYVKTISFTI